MVEKEMKSLTIGETKYEIYDEAARNGVTAIRSESLGGLTFSIAENGILTITKED